MAAASGTQYGAAKARKGEYVASGWDDEPLSSDDASLLIGTRGLADSVGGNYYGLPGSQCWLVWDAKQLEIGLREPAWTNLKKPVQKFTWMWEWHAATGR